MAPDRQSQVMSFNTALREVMASSMRVHSPLTPTAADPFTVAAILPRNDPATRW